MKHLEFKKTSVLLIVLACASHCIAANSTATFSLNAGTVVLLAVLGIPVLAFASYAGFLLFTGKSQRQKN